MRWFPKFKSTMKINKLKTTVASRMKMSTHLNIQPQFTSHNDRHQYTLQVSNITFARELFHNKQINLFKLLPECVENGRLEQRTSFSRWNVNLE